MTLADTLSRAYLPNNSSSELEQDIDCYVHAVIRNLPASDSRLQEIRDEIMKDQDMIKVKSVVLDGWPLVKSQVDKCIQTY